MEKQKPTRLLLDSNSASSVVVVGKWLDHWTVRADTDSDPSPGNVKALLRAAEEMLKQKNMESAMFGGKRMGEQTNREKLDWFTAEIVLEHEGGAAE